MSLRAFIAVVRCPAVKGPARRAAFQLANFHNDKTGLAFPGLSLMAGQEGVSTKTMETGVKQLELGGFVQVYRYKGKGNEYRLSIDKMENLAFVPKPKREQQNTASVQNTSSVGKKPFNTTETIFGSVQKPISAESLTNRIDNQAIQEIYEPNGVHIGRLRKDWERDLAHYRKRLDEGEQRPFWPFNAGPTPNDARCFAPRDLLKRWGFLDQLAELRKAPDGDGS